MLIHRDRNVNTQLGAPGSGGRTPKLTQARAKSGQKEPPFPDHHVWNQENRKN